MKFRFQKKKGGCEREAVTLQGDLSIRDSTVVLKRRERERQKKSILWSYLFSRRKFESFASGKSCCGSVAPNLVYLSFSDVGGILVEFCQITVFS